MLRGLGWQELLILFAILALLFGGSRISDTLGSLGRGIREFRKEARSDDGDGGKDTDDKQPESKPSAAASEPRGKGS
ncbi:MAG: twin-arginine translocase TatA/TatE family subunit [Dehalococcoidia bacterium]|nr:twin-arginine translocase TatA/TatE family subunit [Dehalococcoidia bacterium]